MKLKANSWTIELRFDIGELREVVAQLPSGDRMLVCEVRPAELDKMREQKKDLRGAPRYCALLTVNSMLGFFPAADRDYTVKVRYVPPMREA